MKYYEIMASKNACPRLTNLSYVFFLENINTEFVLSQNLEDFPSFEIEFSPLYLGEPPYTDLIDDPNLGYGITISEKVLKAIKSLNLGKNRIYRIENVFDDDSRIKLELIYFRLQIIKTTPLYLDFIDYKNSIWVTKKYPTDNEIELNIQNYHQYEELKEANNNRIYFKKLKFLTGFENDFPDLFKLDEIASGYFNYKSLICSEKFKQTIEKEMLTGFDFNEIAIEFGK
ncbi:MAG: hypothetical protein MUF43_12645 [Flavobacterium sp.]|jgi:hypothetical protein|nr:hypothetical protein [Flavobacterium sp.]